MSTQYTLKVKNNSDLSGSVCVFQKDPVQSLYENLYSVAWFCKRTIPNTQMIFRWNIDYSLAWSETGLLVPGVHFDASEIWPVVPENPNQNSVILSGENDNYQFHTPAKTSPRNMISVYTDGAIPMEQVSFGIGVSGQTAFVCLASPNYNFTYEPHPEYWIAFGNFEEGEVLDVDRISNAYKVQFPKDICTMTLNLNENCTWSESNN